ncbi:hypothetical protein F7725_002381, partial [Dissostichus mawsoni]
VKVVQPYKVVSSNVLSSPQPFHHQSPLPNNDLSYPFPEPEDLRIFYPPPYLRFTGNGTLIHILGSSDCPAPGAQRQISNKEDEGEEDEDEETAAPVIVPVVVLVILVLFVLIIIMYLQASKCDRGRREIIRPVHTVDAAAFSC